MLLKLIFYLSIIFECIKCNHWMDIIKSSILRLQNICVMKTFCKFYCLCIIDGLNDFDPGKKVQDGII